LIIHVNIYFLSEELHTDSKCCCGRKKQIAVIKAMAIIEMIGVLRCY
jgi:hypothetical protein